MSVLSKISADANNRNATLAGIVLMLSAVFLYAMGDAVGKSIVATYSVGQLLLLRACASFIFLSPIIWRQRAAFRNIQQPKIQLIRVTLGTLEVAAFFLATVYLPLADVITYYLAAPIFVTAASAIFLKESVGWRRWSAIVVGFIGVLIAMRPSTQTVSWPALIALAGCMSFASLMLITRSLRGTPDIVLVTAQMTGTLAFGAIWAPLAWVPLRSSDLGFFALAGAISIGASLCVNRSLKLAFASVVTPYQYTMIIWAVILGYLVFGDVPSGGILVGAAIIIAAGLYIFLRERDLSRAEPVNVPPPG
jgi:drug/metabolite transporter (DMT)-like permease